MVLLMVGGIDCSEPTKSNFQCPGALALIDLTDRYCTILYRDHTRHACRGVILGVLHVIQLCVFPRQKDTAHTAIFGQPHFLKENIKMILFSFFMMARQEED